MAIIVLIVLVILLFSLRSLAVLWTDQLWFSSLHISNVFSTLLEVKVGLGVTFGIFFFLLLFGNLLLADRLGARDIGIVRAMIQPVIDVTARYGGGASFPAADLIYRG